MTLNLKDVMKCGEILIRLKILNWNNVSVTFKSYEIFLELKTHFKVD